MPKTPRIEVIKENKSGLNQSFRDNQTGKVMTRGEFADAIQKGLYDDYHVMKQNNKRIPRSNPDRSKNNNLD